MTAASDQATALRALMETAPGAGETARTAASCPAPVLAIASGKGGVGKSTLAVNIARAWAGSGRRVLVIDGDVGVGSVDVLCGVTAARHMGEVLAGACALEDIVIDSGFGFGIAPGGSGPAGLEHSVATVADSVARARGLAEAVIVDCGAGISPGVLAWLAAADRAVIVATPEPTAISDAYALIKCCIRRGLWNAEFARRASLVVNEVGNSKEGEEVWSRIAHVCRRFLGVELARSGSIRRDQAVSAAVRARKLVTEGWPRSKASADLRALGAALGLDLGLEHPAPPRTLAQRVRILGRS